MHMEESNQGSANYGSGAIWPPSVYPCPRARNGFTFSNSWGKKKSKEEEYFKTHANYMKFKFWYP